MDGIFPQTCGAKTRRGGPCKSYPVKGRRRCRMHGGLSRAWFASPRFKHGRFSKYDIAARLEAEARRTRKRSRFLRGCCRLVDAWAERRGGCTDAEYWARLRAVEPEHRANLERRRKAYKGRRAANA